MAFQNYSLQGYNNNSDWQLSVNFEMFPDIYKYFKSVETLSPILKIADFGCSEGKNSILIFKRLLESFRETSQTPVQVVHTDLPENDWIEFNRLMNDPEFSYISLPNVFFSSIGQSFYNQLFAPNSIHFSYSAYSFHYLSTKAIREPGDMTFPHQNFIKQSHSDIRTLIRLRLEELVSGGVLFIAVVGATETPNANMGTILMKVLMKLVEDGLIAQEDLMKLEWNTHSLSLEVYRSIASEFKDISVIEEISHFKCVSPAFTEYLQTKDLDDYTEKIAKFFFTIMELQVYSILPETRTQSEAAAKLKEVISSTVRISPEKKMYLDTIKLIIRKL